MKTFTLVVLLLLNAGSRLVAQTGEIDLPFAFSQLKGNGLTPFAKALFAGDQKNTQQLVDQLGPLVQGAGDFTSFELLSRRFLTKRVERIVLVIYFDNFPIYMRIDYYENSTGRICLPAKFSKEAAEILPFDLISASGK
jgi:hypothetical protein